MCKPDNELGSPDTRLDLSGCGDNIMISLLVGEGHRAKVRVLKIKSPTYFSITKDGNMDCGTIALAAVGLREPAPAFVGCCEPVWACVGCCEPALAFIHLLVWAAGLRWPDGE